MELSLKGKNALVGGSSKGIGKAAAIELSKLGANVTLMARSADLLEEVLKALDRTQGQEHAFVVADFTDLDDLRKKVQAVVLQKTVHIVVNNTGGPAPGPLVEADPDDFLRAFRMHVLASHTIMQAVLPGMKKAGYGRFINVISTSVKSPIPGLGVSNTIRGAMANWSKTLAGEVAAFGITVNNVLPGATRTERLHQVIAGKAAHSGRSVEEEARAWQAAIPAGRFGEPHELGSVIAFLASPAAAYVNGTNIPVDGGRTPCL